MSFIRYISVLEALAMHPTGASVGKVAANNLVLTHTQVKKTLRDLVGEGMVREEKVQYRPHILSTIYHITEKAREYVGYVADKYDAAELQQVIEFIADVTSEPEIHTYIDTIREMIK